MEDFFKRVKDRGAYIALMEDLIGKELKKDQLFLKDNADLKATCEDFNNRLKLRGDFELQVGSQENGYFLEPCPICYTGNLKKKFRLISIGLNPKFEPARKFEKINTWEELSRYHLPENVQNCNNTYYRVAGHIEPNNSWSQYYQVFFKLHQAWIKGTGILPDWKDNIALFLNEISDYPIANAELLPFKSPKTQLSNLPSVLNSDDDIGKRYKDYFAHLFGFIDRYADDDAYILATATVSCLETLYSTLAEYMGLATRDNFFVYQKHDHALVQNGKKQAYDSAPMYIFKWNRRKIIITSPLSRLNRYSWIYNDDKWIDKIRNFN